MDSRLSRDQSGVSSHRWRGFGLVDQTGPLGLRRLGGRAKSSSPTFAELAMDLLKLLDLQCQLMKVDIREFWSHAKIAMALVILGPACVMAAVPLGLYAVALYIRQALDVPLETVLLVLTLLLMAGTASAMYWAWHRLVIAAKPLERSHNEFQENLRWMRSLLYEEAVAEKPPVPPAAKS